MPIFRSIYYIKSILKHLTPFMIYRMTHDHTYCLHQYVSVIYIYIYIYIYDVNYTILDIYALYILV